MRGGPLDSTAFEGIWSLYLGNCGDGPNRLAERDGIFSILVGVVFLSPLLKGMSVPVSSTLLS